jgi:lipopolysaccharide/colanic/teichoic acid biosynthesis glycosyltransferase
MNTPNEAKMIDRHHMNQHMNKSVPIIQQTTPHRFYHVGKRTMDLVGASVGILICLPVFIILYILIKLEDPGAPAIFTQIRVGKDGKEFKMYKFRSMVRNAESMLQDLLDKNEVSGAMFKMKDDPRVTKIGKFIRRTSLDELPQLWNVLKGDMSLVGPRPPLPHEVEKYTSYHRQRLSVKPGCTGLWQATVRNSVGFEEMVEIDLEYIRNRSLINDIKIILRTLVLLVGHKDAY